MSTPAPVPPESPGWKPTQSTMGGAILGTAIAQLVTALIETFSHLAISAATGGAITTVCVAAAGYFFADGGRK